MDNLERVSNLIRKLHELLSEAGEVKALIQEHDFQSVSSNESMDTDNSDVDEPEPKPEIKNTCCCFIRKQKLK